MRGTLPGGLNPFSSPKESADEANAARPRPRRSLADRLASLRVQAFLCFVTAGLALWFGRIEYPSLAYAVAALGIACGVQCIWRDAKRRDSPLEMRRRR